MDEKEICRLYQSLPDEKIKLYGAYTTRFEGFIDILLSKQVLCSEEVYWLLGDVNTHRGMAIPGSDTRYEEPNASISFSLGHVSFRYYDWKIKSRDQFEGGVGVFVPLQKLLECDPVDFMHSSWVGNIGMYDVTKENIKEEAHRARKEGKLIDSGFGYVFEILLRAEGEYKKWTRFPSVGLTDAEVITVIPESMRDRVYQEIGERQKFYQGLWERLRDPETREEEFIEIGNRCVIYPDKTEALLEKMLEPFDEGDLNLLWYNERNMEVALKRMACLG